MSCKDVQRKYWEVFSVNHELIRLGQLKQSDWRSRFALCLPGLWGGIWESEKVIKGEDREEPTSDDFCSHSPVSKAVVDRMPEDLQFSLQVARCFSLISLLHYFPLIISRE